MKIVTQQSEKINGVLSAFDRIIFKGHMGCLYRKGNFSYFLNKQHILLKDFPAYAKRCSQEVRAHAKEIASECGRPYVHLDSPKISKENEALKIMKKDKIEEGLICVLGSVELCRAFTTRKNSRSGKLEIVTEDRKCLYLYFYYLDKEFGFMHVRLQTWFPFEIQVYINGREYLSHLLDKAGISYERYDNSFIYLSDIEKAQEIADKIQEKKWAPILDAFAVKVNPCLEKIKSILSRGGYFWVLWQCEYATDVMFKSREDLESVYPDWVEYATFCFNSEDVMTFLGRKLTSNFQGEIVSDMKRRLEGIRVKHRMKKNFLKMYDKCNNLRVETIINDPYEFKIYGKVTQKGEEKLAWKPMGKSVANIYRYAEVSKASNLRYLNALALAEDSSEARKQLQAICKPVEEKKGKRYTAFNPLSEECSRIFLAVLDGGNNINGLSNKIIRAKLYPEADSNPVEKKRAVGRTTRLLRKLRAHQLIAKIPRSFRYRVTKKGIRIMAAALKIKRKELPALLKC
jgi:hypothetical protein